MLRRWALSLLLGVAIFAVIAWWLGIFPTAPEGGATPSYHPRDNAQSVEQGNLGGPLYTEAAFPAERNGTHGGQARAEPIAIPDCHLAPKFIAYVSGQLEGRIVVIGKEITLAQATTLPPNLVKKIDVQTLDKKVTRLFRALNEGDLVEQGDMVALLDPVLAYQDLAIQDAKVKATEADRDASIKTLAEAKEQHSKNLELLKKNAIAFQDVRLSQLTVDKYNYEVDSKKEQVTVAEREHKKAKKVLDLHTITNSEAGKWFIQAKIRNQGETLEKGDPKVLLLQRLDQLLAEGLVDLQYRDALRAGVEEVLIEPTTELARERELTEHQGEITSVAVTRNDLIVSAGIDHTVRISRRDGREIGKFAYPKLARVVTCSPPGSSGNWGVSGLEDGSLWMWEVDKVGTQGYTGKHLKEKHAEAVSSLAFSPDGRWFASGGEDNAILLWDTATGTVKYKFNEQLGHSGSVTALQFTRQAKLISAGKDNTLRIWSLRQQGAHLDGGKGIPNRQGSVTSLGATADGYAMLFDMGTTLQVVSGADLTTLGIMNNLSGATPFETLALFAPGTVEDKKIGGKRRLVLTAGLSDGRLQLWVAPARGERAYEVRQLVPPATDRSPVTCAAFSPEAGSKDGAFAVSGTKNGRVFVWEMPTREQIVSYQMPAAWNRIDDSLDTNTRQVRVLVEVANPESGVENGVPRYRLLAGGTVTVVVRPKAP
jgi:WD40 repeat protein